MDVLGAGARSLILLVATLIACGQNAAAPDAGGGGGDAPNVVDDGAAGDGMSRDDAGGTDSGAAVCTPTGTTQCSDCLDNDLDGKIDGFDPECTGPADDREDSFATGIPGDNIDSTKQDCFFDGNSGSGDDGCDQHTCCLLQAPDKATCALLAPKANANQYDRTKCYMPFGTTPVPQKCIDVCGPLTPPGCDCFGCCTVCNASGCADIIINPAVSPDCNQDNITDLGPDGIDSTGDEPCKRCVKITQCGNTECGGETCILCPGQDPSTLPSHCTEQTCPDGISACDGMGACPAGKFCSNGCCIGTIL
jgi:hypothetical protein